MTPASPPDDDASDKPVDVEQCVDDVLNHPRVQDAIRARVKDHLDLGPVSNLADLVADIDAAIRSEIAYQREGKL